MAAMLLYFRGKSMKKLTDLLKNLDYKLVQGDLDNREVEGIVYDSRKAFHGCLFVCVKGANFDGHQFASAVADVGAKTIVVEDDVEVRSDVTVIKVPDTREALAILSANWFGNPGDRIKVIGITGTKGKTTTTYMIKSILENAGYKVGLIGTIEAIIGDKHIPSKNTTPESYEIQEDLAAMEKEGITICVMEVSSQGLMLHRVDGMTFEIGIFTNISPDHIGPNEHTSFEEYLHCKSLLFQKCRKGILNIDDPHMNDILKDHTCTVETFGFSEKADFRAEDMELFHEKGVMGVNYKVTGKVNFDVKISVPGRFSVYNSLCAIAVCAHFNVKTEDMQKALLNAKVKGRIEPYPASDRYTVLIDYAHNAMALESLLTTLKEYNPGRIVTIFGCGGNRSKERRFEMGEVSGRLSDFTVITSDNPRFEEPEAIIADIVTGIKKTDGKYVTITDRKEAIKYALSHAEDRDVIVLAGKGHEDYQEIRGKKYHMDERELLAQALAELRN
jgi:UDP-N-acetylmuramoyl-L-alanyl-D-glutamate--2,6-diaminopimelate ligase